MTSTQQLYKRVLRRETHSPRSTAAILVAVLAILALAWLGTECVLAALGQNKLLLSPTDMVAGIVALPTIAAALLVGAGIVLAILGLVLIGLAVRPGRLGRHTIADDRAAITVHNEVIASALARQAAITAAADPDRTVASVTARKAKVTLTPTSGSRIDQSAVQSAVSSRLEQFGLAPKLTARVKVNKEGKVGG